VHCEGKCGACMTHSHSPCIAPGVMLHVELEMVAKASMVGALDHLAIHG
jgi:hypothetical protein